MLHVDQSFVRVVAAALSYNIISGQRALTHGIVAGAFGAQKEGRYSVRLRGRAAGVWHRHQRARGAEGGALLGAASRQGGGRADQGEQPAGAR